MTAEPDALRLVPDELKQKALDLCLHRIEGFAGFSGGKKTDIHKLVTDLLAAPAVQPAAGREEIARRIIRDAFISGRTASTTTTGAQDQADAEAYASERDVAAMFTPAGNVGDVRRPMETAGEVERLRDAVEQAIRCLCTRIPGGVMHGDETMSVLRAALSQPGPASEGDPAHD